MAVYQYYLAIIPLEGIMKKHDSIPSSIQVSTETGFFESDAETYWQEVEIKADEILPQMDLLVKRENWENRKTSFYWKTKTNNIDNDAAMYLNHGTSKISEFYFRADLREKNLIFLRNMIDLGKEYNWMFMDIKGKLMNPDFDEIKISIKESSAYHFLKDPIAFFKSYPPKE